jgi:transposase
LAKSEEGKLNNKRGSQKGSFFGKMEVMMERKVVYTCKKEKKMCLKPEIIEAVPEETARIARAAYPKGNIYLQLRDTFGTIYQDEQFVDLYPRQGQPAEAPWRLALVSVMQFREGFSDRQAADAVRGRMDWKYLLGLELSDPGFNYSILSEFRQRFLSNEKDLLVFDLFLMQLRERGLSQNARATTYRLDACSGENPFTQPRGRSWRNLSGSLE